MRGYDEDLREEPRDITHLLAQIKEQRRRNRRLDLRLLGGGMVAGSVAVALAAHTFPYGAVLGLVVVALSFALWRKPYV